MKQKIRGKYGNGGMIFEILPVLDTAESIEILWNHPEPFTPFHPEDQESREEAHEFLLRLFGFDGEITHTHGVENSSEEWRSLKNLSDVIMGWSREYGKGLWDTLRNYYPIERGDEPDTVVVWRLYDNRTKFKNITGNLVDMFSTETIHKTFWESDKEWEEHLTYLRSRFNVVELDYRMKLSDVYEVLKKARLVIGYSGMYHHMVKLMGIPMIGLMNELNLDYNAQKFYFIDDCRSWGQTNISRSDYSIKFLEKKIEECLKQD